MPECIKLVFGMMVITEGSYFAFYGVLHSPTKRETFLGRGVLKNIWLSCIMVGHTVVGGN